MDIKTLVIDDEPLARQRIIHWLSKYPEIRVVGECKNGLEAIEQIESRQIDLIFLDIQMPELNGFEALGQLQVDPMPFIIFVTAFDQYALDAFEHHAVDYLLKPLDRERFGKAIDKVLLQCKGRISNNFNERLRGLLNDYEQQMAPHRETFVLKEKGQVKVIPSDDIFYLESEGNYVSLQLENSHHLYRASMNNLEGKLVPLQFLRIHRSIMVNCLHLDKVQYLNNETYKFVLNNGQSRISGRSFKTNIQDFLKHASYIKQF